MAARDLDSYGVPGWLQATPFALVFAAFFVLPLVFVVIVSFWDYNDYQMLPTFTTRSYVESFDGCLNDLPNLCTMFKTYVSTAKFCFIVWALTLVIGFTVAYFLAFHVRSATMQMVLFLVCTIPFWTSNVIRMISWIPLLGRNGLVNQMLVGAHVVNAPVEWLLYSPFSVALAFVHLFTFFMVAPIFNSMMRIDRRLMEAAYDAGASGWQMLTNVIVPLVQAGHRHRLDLRRHHRHGRLHHLRRDGRRADRLGRQGDRDAPRRAAIPARGGQRGDPARRDDADHRRAQPHRRHPQGA